MKKILKVQFIIVAIIALLFVNINVVDAASSAKVSVSGTSTMTTGGTATNKIIVGSISGSTVNAVSGTVSIADTSCVRLDTMTGLNGTSASGGDFILASFSGISANTDMLSLKLIAGSSACTTSIKVSDIAIGFMNGDTLEPADVVFNITVGAATPKNGDATLKSLSPDKGTLSPAFASGTTSYEITVPSDTTSVSFTATPNSSKSTVSGTTCTLSGDTTTCTITVTAEDGTKKSYTVKVNKEKSTDPGTADPEPTPGPSNICESKELRLKSLKVQEGFPIDFDKDVYSYSLSVGNAITSLKVLYETLEESATATITGASNFKVGTNPIKVTVNNDGCSSTYIINVKRASDDDGSKKAEDPKSSDATLKELYTSNGDLSPAFDKNIIAYSITVPNEVTSLDLTALANNSKAKVEIIGNENFEVNKVNVVKIKVTAEDGSELEYIINVTRSDKKSQNKLKEIEIGGGYTLSPKFDPDTFTYTVDVDKDIDKLDITALPEFENSEVEIIGNEKLQNGNNVILIKVTDENGFVQYYRINVNKNAVKKFLGLSLKQWLIILGMLILLGIIFFLLFLLKKKKEDKDDEDNRPIIEFNPEFNFGSKNGTDDDYVESGAVLNQYTGKTEKEEQENIDKKFKDMFDHEYQEKIKNNNEEEKFDYYDDKVTKEELLAAIEEAKRTKDSSKLKMLYKQEMLNREKEALRKKDKDNQ